ncbi:MAG: YbjN domain-containing protein [Rhizobiaceae bacterium]|nr:YbjN domain-containing protein [Rhizobiaceae bacterium]
MKRSRMQMLAAVLAIGGVLSLSEAALSKDARGTIHASNPEGIASILRGFGSALVGTDSYGDPKIDGRSAGEEYTVLFYGCTDNIDCRSIAFWTYWTVEVDLDRVNEWNKRERYGKLYVDNDGDLALEMDVNLSHGMDTRTFDEIANIWAGMLDDVKSNVVD